MARSRVGLGLGLWIMVKGCDCRRWVRHTGYPLRGMLASPSLSTQSSLSLDTHPVSPVGLLFFLLPHLNDQSQPLVGALGRLK